MYVCMLILFTRDHLDLLVTGDSQGLKDLLDWMEPMVVLVQLGIMVLMETLVRKARLDPRLVLLIDCPSTCK